MAHSINIQDSALFGWLKEDKKLGFELLTGKTIPGRIRRFDRYCILMETDSGAQLLIYKHALSSIQDPHPSRSRSSFDDFRRPRAVEPRRPRRVAVAGAGRR